MKRPALRAADSVCLAEATVQEIQLELIRRRRFNEFDGAKVAASLARHRELWLAVYMDRFGVYREQHPDWFPAMSLIQLRDLRHNEWNVDTLIALTKDLDKARALTEIAAKEDWQADEVVVQDNEEELSMALGIGPCPYYALSAWWD